MCEEIGRIEEPWGCGRMEGLWRVGGKVGD